uniref:Uncharacterized protein n=1 Tax=Cryptomonas curvata TaxID=233186 RepID=A0A7S0M4X7_9CRYP|mmetsp:Transcript_21135/g.44392  ORF Transcript_21135/g.44392 Transcript_21135/m.44392 type:complete len:136 (+) Transcript_21135:254-661(+)
MLVLSCVPWIASGWGILYFKLSALDNQPVSDSKHCSPAEAVIYVATTVHLIYLCVNSALKSMDNEDKVEKAVNVVVTAVVIIMIAAFVHLQISNHMKSMCCTAMTSRGSVLLLVGFTFVFATTLIALTLSKPSLE